MVDTKYLFAFISDSNMIEYPPNLYLDWYRLRGNLKRSWRVNDSFVVTIGVFKYRLHIEFKWNHREREKTPEELEITARIESLFEKVKDD